MPYHYWENLFQKLLWILFTKMVKKISILLDKDVKTKFLYYVSYFMNNGITVTNILPTEKDASEMGFSQINKN